MNKDLEDVIRICLEHGIELTTQKRRYCLYLSESTGKYTILSFGVKPECSSLMTEEEHEDINKAIERWIQLNGLSTAVLEKKKNKGKNTNVGKSSL